MKKLQRALRPAMWVAGLGLLSSWAPAQYASVNVNLLFQLDLPALGASNGNDCWGYVSPGGREYALMDVNNKIAFVEITNPAQPVYFASIPHASSTWGDLETYGTFLYAVTETAGTGVQVIDLSQIDSHVVTLVRTISSPGRSHTLSVDPIAGYLYTNGSNLGTGTTMCFSLANPSNPVQVGANSMTTNYQHDGRPVTYTSGPLAGRTLWYGFSEGRGVDIYDFTNKNAPVMIARATYPSMGYCHQGWLSDDLKYLYVDDEFDEQNLGVNTRSLVFNVQDPANPVFIGTFTSGEPSIDHNQYWRAGFLSQSNYRSGLRIFDTMTDPEHPVQTGWFDTYPADNGQGYQGTWSNYPFLPSGNIIISDINRGLFVVDPTAAVTRTRVPVSMSVSTGTTFVGGLPELAVSDNTRMALTYNATRSSNKYGSQLTITGSAMTANPKKLQIVLETSSVPIGTPIMLRAWDYVSASWVTLDQRLATGTDSSFTVVPPGLASRYIEQGTRNMKAMLLINATGGATTVSVDQFVWQTIW